MSAGSCLTLESIRIASTKAHEYKINSFHAQACVRSFLRAFGRLSFAVFFASSSFLLRVSCSSLCFPRLSLPSASSFLTASYFADFRVWQLDNSFLASSILACSCSFVLFILCSSFGSFPVFCFN